MSKELSNPKNDIAVVCYRFPSWDNSQNVWEVGEWVMSSWEGKTHRLWIQLNTDEVPPLALIQQHVVSAFVLSNDEDDPDDKDGWLLATAFVRD